MVALLPSNWIVTCAWSSAAAVAVSLAAGVVMDQLLSMLRFSRVFHQQWYVYSTQTEYNSRRATIVSSRSYISCRFCRRALHPTMCDPPEDRCRRGRYSLSRTGHTGVRAGRRGQRTRRRPDRSQGAARRPGGADVVEPPEFVFAVCHLAGGCRRGAAEARRGNAPGQARPVADRPTHAIGDRLVLAGLMRMRSLDEPVRRTPNRSASGRAS